MQPLLQPAKPILIAKSIINIVS